MSKASLLVLVGTKAQFIKTAPILREMDARGMSYRLVYTGQHSETFDLLEAAFGTRPPDEVLVPTFEASTHISFLSWTLRYWRAVLKRVRSPEWRRSRIGLVHGDTASTLFSALALRLAGVPVGHVEAGLRSPRLLEPFPEEIIRRLVSRMSQWHFAPDATAAGNLARIGGRIVDTGGNTLKDALVLALERGAGERGPETTRPYAVVSMHRSENLSNRAVLDMLMQTVIETARNIDVRFVLHPATRDRIRATGWLPRLQDVEGLHLLERMAYPDFVRLLVGSRFLMTDGGSNQEEAAMMGLPTLLLRRATERGDGLGHTVELSKLEPERIAGFVARHAGKTWHLQAPPNGSPSRQVVDVLQAIADGAV
jgi:UDP-N-acetylglucosamine 2-epimerase (non-hydrolysing)